jgi:protein-disulfide isomerase
MFTSSPVRRLAVAAGAAVVLVVAAILVSSAGGTSHEPASKSTPSTLFAGLPERSGVVGAAKAPVTVTEYLDLQCPVCKRAAETTLPVLVRDYVRTGKVKLAARTLHFIGPDSVSAAQVAAGAERQGKLWPFIDAFYARQGTENSGYATEAMLRETARAAGADPAKALDAADTPFAAGQLKRANDDAARLGIQATPTLTVRHGSGPERVLDANPLDPASVAAALDKELAR